MKKIIATILLFLIPTYCFGAIGFIGGVATQNGSGTTLTTALNCTGGNFLIVSTLYTSEQITNVSYAGVNMTKVIDQNVLVGGSGSVNNVQYWVLPAIASGSNNIVSTKVGTATTIKYSATCYSGVNQSTTVDNSIHVELQPSGSGNATTNMTTASGAWIVASVNSDGANDPDSAVNLTPRNGDGITSRVGISDSNTALSAGSNSFGYHVPGAADLFIIAISIAPPSVPVKALPPLIIGWQGYW